MNADLHNALIALQEQSPCLWFGKYFMHSLVTGQTSFPQITINYHDDKSFYTAVGVLLGKKCCSLFQRNEDGSGTFRVGGTDLLLRKKKMTVVADFDYLGYDLESGKLRYQGATLPEWLRAKFAMKKCTLEFDPYEKQDDSELWVARRKAILSYIEGGWTLLDANDNPVNFVNVSELSTDLDPQCLWLPTRNSVVAVETKLTMEGFHKELSELITKYADIFVGK